MNVIKHMEAAFLLTLSVAGAASVAIDAIPPAQAASQPAVQAAAPAENNIATPTTMAVVKVSAKRMSALEKRQSLAGERSGSRI